MSIPPDLYARMNSDEWPPPDADETPPAPYTADRAAGDDDDDDESEAPDGTATA